MDHVRIKEVCLRLKGITKAVTLQFMSAYSQNDRSNALTDKSNQNRSDIVRAIVSLENHLSRKQTSREQDKTTEKNVYADRRIRTTIDSLKSFSISILSTLSIIIKDVT